MYAITGASGQLGRLVIDHLLKTVPAGEIVAAVRNPAKVSDLAARGVIIREADYTRPDTLPVALAGVDKLLLISSTEVKRLPAAASQCHRICRKGQYLTDCLYKHVVC